LSVLRDIGLVDSALSVYDGHRRRQEMDRTVKTARDFSGVLVQCHECDRSTPALPPYTPSNWNGVVIVDGAPSSEDWLYGRDLGRDGPLQLLRGMLSGAGVDINRCYLTSAVKCFSVKRPMSHHIAACSPFLSFEIHRLSSRARCFVVMGEASLRAIIGPDVSGINRYERSRGMIGGVPFLITQHAGVCSQNEEVAARTLEAFKEFFNDAD